MNEIFSEIKNARKKKLIFGYKELYRLIKPINKSELNDIEDKNSFNFPSEIMATLIELGSCTIGDELNLHSPSEIYPLDEDNGNMKGFVIFASDTLGNYFAFKPNGDGVYFLCHDPLGSCLVASSFKEFLKKFIEADYKLEDFSEKLDSISLK